MHLSLPSLLVVFLLTGISLQGSESRIPRLYEFESPVPEMSSTDVLRLADFVVIGQRYETPSSVERDLERFLNGKKSFEIKDRRVEIVPDNSLPDLSFGSDEGRNVVRGSTSSGLDLKLQDVFLIDLPGGGVLKAQFKSGLSVRVNKNMKIILRPSRKKLLSFRWDW